VRSEGDVHLEQTPESGNLTAHSCLFNNETHCELAFISIVHRKYSHDEINGMVKGKVVAVLN